MTAYVVSITTTASFDFSGSGPADPIFLSFSPVLYETKLLQIEYTLTNVNDTYDGSITPVMQFTPAIYRYSTGTASGGTAVTPVALRQGASASSTTSRWGTGVAVSGTATHIASLSPLKTSPTIDIGETYKSPFDLTVSPGGVFLFTTGSIGGSGASSATNSGRVQIVFYFEEFKLAWRY
jgi:hypothetical protein